MKTSGKRNNTCETLVNNSYDIAINNFKKSSFKFLRSSSILSINTESKLNTRFGKSSSSFILEQEASYID